MKRQVGQVCNCKPYIVATSGTTGCCDLERNHAIKRPVKTWIGGGNVVFPYLWRHANPKWIVHVYRNWTKDGGMWTIEQRGRVVYHAKRLMLHNCRFYVSQITWGKFKAQHSEGKKPDIRNHFAYIAGYLSLNGGMGTDASDVNGLPAEVEFNPVKDNWFWVRNLTEKGYKITGADCTILHEDGRITAAYTYGK